MEKIDKYQLAAMIILFEVGSSSLFVSDQSVIAKVSVFSYLTVGVFLLLLNVFNIMALSAPITELSQLPLLHTVRIVSLGSFLERIDPLIVLLLIIALYTKLTMRYLGAVVTLMQLIPKLDRRWFVVAVGALMYFTSFLEPNYPYHIWLGVEISTLRIFPFFQIVFPALLLAIVKLKRTSAPTGS